MNRFPVAPMSALACGLICGSVMAQNPVIDGAITIAEYGNPLWLNTDNPTGFGDNNDPTASGANGSEMDGVYATIGTDFFGDPVLYIGITGNVETNFNKLAIFLDTVPGVGQNQLRGDNPDVDFNGLNRMGDDLDTPEIEGLRFDAQFTANAWVSITTGNFDPDTGLAEIYYNYADLDDQVGEWLGQNFTGDPDGIIFGSNSVGAQGMIDNSNIEGVTDLEASAALSGAVQTGVEFMIPLVAINAGDDDILLTVFINGSGHDFVSNQITGGHPYGVENLGEPRDLDLQCVFGNQFVVVENVTPREPMFVLHVSPLVAGGRAQFLTEGSTPGGRVYFVYSLRGFGSTNVPQLGITLDLDSPSLIDSDVASAQGVATITPNIPSAAAGRTVFLQAAERGAKTNAIACPIN